MAAKTMPVRALCALVVAGRDGRETVPPGSIARIPAEEAASLVSRGFAEWAEKQKSVTPLE